MTGEPCVHCGEPASDTFLGSPICEACTPGDETTEGAEGSDPTGGPLEDGALADLGAVFVPIPPREKGTRRPRTPENLFGPDDPVLQSYLEAGHNYGVVCRDDLAVVDADEPERLEPLLGALPATAWQVSGSRTSEHYFLRVPGLDADLPLIDPETEEELGHIKGAAQSYVVGPGSTHPSGNEYGPLKGDEIATVTEADLRDLIDPFRPAASKQTSPARGSTPKQTSSTGDAPDLSVHDVLSRGRNPEGGRCEHPFHGSDTGANFMVDEGGDTWRCWRHGCTGNALHLVGMELGVIDCGDWQHGGLSTDIWSDVFEAARETGYDVGEPLAAAGDAAHVAALPDAPSLPEDTTGWNWRRAGAVDGPVERVRERTTTAIADVFGSGDQVLLEAIPTLGKSYGSIEVAARTGEPVTILTTRGRKEQYDQLREWARDAGLEAYTLPAFTHDCDTANGEHGAEWRERVMDWYRRGATPKEIHKHAESELGHPLPCQQGEHTCPYTQRWDFDPSEFDVLLGHYTHAHKRKVTAGRTVIVDEFPGGAYETCLDHGLEGAVSYFLKCHDALPFDDYTDLIEGRHDDPRRADALLWFQDHDLEPDGLQVFGDQGGHAAAPQAVYTILVGATNHLGNGWERAPFGDGSRVGLFNREQGQVWLLTPPAFDQAAGLLGLDGTPTKDLWDLTMGTRLEHRLVLDDDERREYLSEGLGLKFVRTTEAIKPYNNSDHVAVGQDAALIEAIREQHGERPDLITTSAALDEYDAADLLDGVGETGYYGNVLGSNAFADSRLGIVVGSNHYGDGYVKKWAAYAGATAERGDEKGAGLTYGAFGDSVLTHMREHDTLQAALRFGRDGNGAVVYVHTDTLPDWVPLAGEGRVLSTWSDGMRQVLDVATGLDEWTAAEIAADPRVDVTQRQVQNILNDLHERGDVDRRWEGRGYVWRDTGLHRVSEYGEVELKPVDLDALDDETVEEIARSSYYTWDFSNLDESRPGGAADPPSSDVAPDEVLANGGDPPPDGGE